MKFSQEGLALTDSKIKALKEAPLPSTQSELRSFLGLSTYCSKSIPNLASISDLLWKKIRTKIKSDGSKNKSRNLKLIWSDDEVKQFNKVKESVLKVSLAFYNCKWDTCLEVDASPVGVGAVLFQVNPKDKEEKKIIAFWSQKLSDVESRYSQYEKEALAVTLAVEKFRVYLIGRIFKLYTDNQAVEAVYKNPNSTPSARIRHFNLRLVEHEFEIFHKPGKSNVADYFSRNPIENVGVERETWLAEQYIFL